MPVRGKRMFQAMTLFIRHRRPLILSALAGTLATLLMIAAPVVVAGTTTANGGSAGSS